MMEAARQCGVKKFVYASSSSVYGDEPNLPKKEGREGNLLSPYALTKRCDEEWAKQYTKHYGLDTYGMRYFNVFGRRQDPHGAYAAVIPKFIKQLLDNERPTINGDGKQSRDFTYIENVIEANLKACLAPSEYAGEAFNIAYGEEFLYETTKYNPHSPYSASKASSDHFVRAYHDTYGMPTIVTNCSNNYGPYQFPEKLIPLFINNIRKGKPLPVYGRGENVRDWLYVEDHARAIDLIFHKGEVAATYNIGGCNEWKNIDLIKVMIRTVDRLLGNPEGHSLGLITYVTDRPGHDARYAIDSSRLQNELGWKPSLQFEEGIEKTVMWYLDNQEWMDDVTSGEYVRYYDSMYSGR